MSGSTLVLNLHVCIRGGSTVYSQFSWSSSFHQHKDLSPHRFDGGEMRKVASSPVAFSASSETHPTVEKLSSSFHSESVISSLSKDSVI